jgi:Nuclease-related domain
VNYARRQQYRRLSRAGSAAAGSGAAVLLALVLASVGAISLAGLLLLTAVALGLYTRYWLGLARRSRVGAQSEDEVRRVLAALEAEGWRVRHGLRWQGRGDVDSVAIAPGGIGFAIETRTRSYDQRHLRRVWEQAAWLSRRRRRWCRCGALPVLCVVRGHGVQRWEDDVLVVSLDRLTPFLRSAIRESSGAHT